MKYHAKKRLTHDGRVYNEGDIVETNTGEGVDGLEPIKKGDISEPSRKPAPVNGVEAGAPMPNDTTPDVKEREGVREGEASDGSKPEDRENAGRGEGHTEGSRDRVREDRKPSDNAEVMDHVVTKEDLEANPALSRDGVAEGATVQYRRKADGEGFEYVPQQG